MNPLDILNRTPKTNCGECGHPTCLAFAAAVSRAGLDINLCPYIDLQGLEATVLSSKKDMEDLAGQVAEEHDWALVKHLREKISKVDFGSIAGSLGAGWNEHNPDVLSLRYLGQEVMLGKAEIFLSNDALVDPRDQILLYNYVSSGGGDIPLENWVGMESLPNSISKVRTLSVYCEQPLARRFSGRSGQLARICSQVGALPGPEGQSATLGVIIPVLPRVVHYLLFWDEEPEDGFDSRVKVLFDDHVLDFLDIESLVFSAERMAERVMELDS